MMDNKLFKLAIGLAAAVAFSGQAGATTYAVSYSDLTGLGYENIVSGLQGNFSDTYTFTLPVASYIGGSLSVNNHTLLGKVISNISGLTETLSNSGGTIFSNSGTFQDASGMLGAGSYSFVISGMGSGSRGGNYTLDASAQPVPEPTESALMLSGIAMLGFIAARRKKSA